MNTPNANHHHKPSTASYLSEHFRPGIWQQRYQRSLSCISVVSGSYVRDSHVSGGWSSTDVHYFDMSLDRRSNQTRVSFEGSVAQPIGEVFFVPAYSAFKAESGPGKQNNLFVFLDEKPLHEDEETLFLTLKGMSPHALNVCRDVRKASIKRVLHAVAKELYSPGFSSNLMMEGLGLTLLAETVRFLKSQEVNAKTGGLSSRCLRIIKERVEQNEHWPTIAELADLCGLSRRHLMRGFVQSTGQSLGTYVQSVAMARACDLLKDTEDPIHEVAARVGFSSPASFSTAFRRTFYQTPRQYRQNNTGSAFSINIRSALHERQ